MKKAEASEWYLGKTTDDIRELMRKELAALDQTKKHLPN